jgi:hypothetical protein
VKGALEPGVKSKKKGIYLRMGRNSVPGPTLPCEAGRMGTLRANPEEKGRPPAHIFSEGGAFSD